MHERRSPVLPLLGRASLGVALVCLTVGPFLPDTPREEASSVLSQVGAPLPVVTLLVLRLPTRGVVLVALLVLHDLRAPSRSRHSP